MGTSAIGASCYLMSMPIPNIDSLLELDVETRLVLVQELVIRRRALAEIRRARSTRSDAFPAQLV